MSPIERKMVLSDAYVKVAQMRIVFGQKTYFDGGDNANIAQNLQLQAKICIEEIKETLDALFLFDKIEFIDGNCDCLVTGMGMFHELDTDITSALDNPPDLSLTQFFNIVSDITDMILEYEEEEEYTFSVDDCFNIARACTILPLYCLEHRSDLNIQENFNIVHETNMAKFFTNRILAEKDVDIYTEEGVICNVVQSGNYFLIKRNDLKVLKPKGWKPPVLIVK